MIMNLIGIVGLIGTALWLKNAHTAHEAMKGSNSLGLVTHEDEARKKERNQALIWAGVSFLASMVLFHS